MNLENRDRHRKRATPQFNWLTEIVVKVPAELQPANSFWLSLNYRNATSNKALTMLTHKINHGIALRENHLAQGYPSPWRAQLNPPSCGCAV